MKLNNIIKTVICIFVIILFVFVYFIAFKETEPTNNIDTCRMVYAEEIDIYSHINAEKEISNTESDNETPKVEYSDSTIEISSIVEEVKNENAIEYTQEELEMMEYVVEQETEGASLEHKRIVSYVIINRVKSELFPDNVKDVLTAKNQFSAIDNYYYKYNEPEEITKQAVFEALNGQCEDESGGALYFYAPRWCGYMSYFENKPFVLEMEGHRFFK